MRYNIEYKYNLSYKFMQELMLLAILVFGVFLNYNAVMITMFVPLQAYLILRHNSVFAGFSGIGYFMAIFYKEVWLVGNGL